MNIARAFFREIVSFLEANKTEMSMLDTVAEKIFRIITTVEDDDAVLINIERFQILQMFHGGSAFRSKIALERGMNDIVVKIGRRIWKLNFGTINGKKMVTMPESAGRKLIVKQVYREIEKFLEKRGIDKLPGLGKCLL